MKIDTLFFKFLVFFSILLIMALVRKNIKELFTTTSEMTTGKLVASIHDSDKTEDSYNVTLNWTIDPTLKVEYYIFSKLDHGPGSVLEETTYEFVNNLVIKDMNTYKINNLDYGKKYKLGLSCYNSETSTGNIVSSYMTGNIEVKKPEGKTEQQLLQQVSKNQVSCNPDGSYVITNNCSNNKPINSNYTKNEYDELMEYLTRVTKYRSE